MKFSSLQQVSDTSAKSVTITNNLTNQLAAKEEQLSTLIKTNSKHVKKIEDLERQLKSKGVLPNDKCKFAPPDYGKYPKTAEELKLCNNGGYCYMHGFKPREIKL